jgi:hypothetical protein
VLSVTWNAWVGQSEADVLENGGRLVQELDLPVVVALQEVWRCRRPLAGYKRYAADGGHPENASTQLHVRRGVQVLQEFYLRPGGPNWHGPKHGLVHPPRVFPGVTLRYAKEVWDVIGIHRVSGGPDAHLEGNRECWRREDERLQAFADSRARRHPTRRLLMLGDWNNGAGDRSPLSVRDLAGRIGADLELVGVDGGLARGARLAAKELPDLYGSDNHRPVVLTT